MEKYKVLEHLADLKIKVFGLNRKELFTNALIGMFESIEPDIISRDERSRKIEVSSKSEELILIDFLSEALYQSDINNEAYHRVEFEALEPTRIIAKLFGYKVKGFREEIKAVTYHDFKIIKTDNGLEAEIIFDI